LSWFGGVIRGNLGTSLASQGSVSGLIVPRLENTLILMLLTSSVAFPLSIALGALAALRRDGSWDRFGLIVALIIASLPEFVLGMLLVILLATTVLHVLPAVTLVLPGASPLSNPKSLVLPVLVLTLAVVPYLYRLVRASTIDVLESEFIYMARLKGLPDRTILTRHALPNALIPAIQASALVLAYLLGGVVVVEYLFGYPGLGGALLEAVQNRDLPVIQAIVLIFAAGIVVFNLVADITIILANPRLRTAMSADHRSPSKGPS
jgi:peptide/nickel transport system permease protein